ncbi:MAG: uracil-DNA glycosylase family [Planctomycetota bacterium]|nr:MAG: uracil-DNA glycosylase family [Planctomycetota bacterium]
MTTDPRKALKDHLADWKSWGVDAVPRASEPASAATTDFAPAAPVPAPTAVATPNASAPSGAASCTDLESLRALVATCTACTLCKTRTQTVFCSGNPSPILFVGEAPGADEDAKGEVFVGRAGKLLTELLKGVGISRDRIYIANVLKCRPPDNRPPEPAEVAACAPFLKRQIELINPKVICALGKHAAFSLIGWEGSMKALRGSWRLLDNRWVTATYHPSYLLRSPGDTETVKTDLRGLLEKAASLGARLP